MITFLATASGISLLGLGSAFWGIVIGFFAYMVLNKVGLNKMRLNKSELNKAGNGVANEVANEVANKVANKATKQDKESKHDR
jgi:Na+/glutamate symporter